MEKFVFVLKINIVVSKELPKMANVSNVIQKKIYFFFVVVKEFYKHLSSKKFEFSDYFLMCQTYTYLSRC